MPKASVLGFALALAGCAPAVSPLTNTTPSCHASNDLNAPIRWIAAADNVVERSGAACDGVGPVAIRISTTPDARAHDGVLFVVSWNVAIGAAHVQPLLQRLLDDERRAKHADPDFILLLQEAFRTNDKAIGARQREDVLALGAQLGMNLAYVPSMRSGSGDRGNAILSTLPLHGITAIELPFVRQRRVAVAAAVDSGGSRLTVISVHLSTRERFLRGSIFSAPFARERQATALVASTRDDAGPVIVGGDFNTFAGPQEPAIRRMERHFARIDCGSPITHQWGLSLDHFFASDPSIVQDCGRITNRYGSDHHPLVARASIGSAGRSSDR